MHRKSQLLVAALSFALVFTACPKKTKDLPPTPPPVQTEVVPPPADVSASTSPSTSMDPVESAPPRDLQQIQDDAMQRGLLGDVFFDFDQYDLTPEARQRLERNAEFMRTEGRDLTFTIEGHCDERGTNEYNLALGQRRATTTVDYLATLGVDLARFRTLSYGEERPYCTESTETCWQRNRRAHFVVSGTR